MRCLASTGGANVTIEVAPSQADGRPYGLVGLAVGLVLILFTALFFCVVEALLIGAIAALVLGVQQALALLSSWREAAAGGDPRFLQAAVVVLSMLFYTALAAAVVFAALVRGRSQWRYVIGWRPWQPFRRSRLFWALAAGTIVYGVAADALVSRLYPPSKTWVTVPGQPLWAVLFVVLAVVFAPIAEELLFRGWIYTGLRRRIGIWESINVSAALFAIAHWESTQIYALVVFPVGLALSFIREKTGSLKASMAFHAIYNGAASLLLLFGP